MILTQQGDLKTPQTIVINKRHSFKILLKIVEYFFIILDRSYL